MHVSRHRKTPPSFVQRLPAIQSRDLGGGDRLLRAYEDSNVPAIALQPFSMISWANWRASASSLNLRVARANLRSPSSRFGAMLTGRKRDQIHRGPAQSSYPSTISSDAISEATDRRVSNRTIEIYTVLVISFLQSSLSTSATPQKLDAAGGIEAADLRSTRSRRRARKPLGGYLSAGLFTDPVFARRYASPGPRAADLIPT